MRVFCIFSDDRVFHSKSPEMFSAVLKQVGIKGEYVPFKVDKDMVGKAVESIRVLNIEGANVTVPYKELVIPYLDILSEGANIIGSINTIVRKGKTLKGYNTNAIGFMDALNSAGFDITGKRALVFGTGGVARAVVFILNWLRAESIHIAGRNMGKALEIGKRLGGETVQMDAIQERAPAVDLVINATSVSSPEESSELAELVRNLPLTDCQMIYDLNYGRAVNFWQETAQLQKIPFMDGLSALAYQAKRTFALWTGVQVPAEIFLKTLEAE